MFAFHILQITHAKFLHWNVITAKITTIWNTDIHTLLYRMEMIIKEHDKQFNSIIRDANKQIEELLGSDTVFNVSSFNLHQTV